MRELTNKYADLTNDEIIALDLILSGNRMFDTVTSDQFENIIKSMYKYINLLEDNQ
jgi:hypothetical protein